MLDIEEWLRSSLQASALSKFRHPSILGACVALKSKLFVLPQSLPEMVEPLEETRTELTFATEPVMSSLELAIPGAGKLASLVELDEVEVRASHFAYLLL